MKAALVAAGMPPAAVEAELAKLPARPATEDVELEADDDGASVALFHAMSTQWRFAGMGERVGLDNTAIAATAGPLDIIVDAQRMIDLRDMEDAALAVLAEKRT